MPLLIDRFLRNMEEVLQKAKIDNHLIMDAEILLPEIIRQSEKIFFARSTIKMLLEKNKCYDVVTAEVLARLPDDAKLPDMSKRDKSAVWLEFEEDLVVPVENIAPISALFIWIPSQWINSVPERTLVYFIRRDGVAFGIMSNKKGRPWEFGKEIHTCPTGRCIRDHDAYFPCEVCGEFLVFGAQIFTLSAILSKQYLAETRYAERIEHSTQRVQRQHSKKKKTVAVNYRFKVIDASEILLPVPADVAQSVIPPQGSWLEEAKAEDDVEYRDIRTRPFSRTYRHSRFTNCQGKTIEFPNGVQRRQPVRKSVERQTRVVASKYD